MVTRQRDPKLVAEYVRKSSPSAVRKRAESLTEEALNNGRKGKLTYTAVCYGFQRPEHTFSDGRLHRVGSKTYCLKCLERYKEANKRYL